jgi:hypothetical protein
MPIGRNRALIIAAAPTANATPPPPASEVASANWAEPENTSNEQTTGASVPQPSECAMAPNVTPMTNVGTPIPSPTRTPAAYPLSVDAMMAG